MARAAEWDWRFSSSSFCWFSVGFEPGATCQHREAPWQGLTPAHQLGLLSGEKGCVSGSDGGCCGVNYAEFMLLALGWSAQTCTVNSLSRCNSKLRIISSNEVPVGAPEGLKRQPHSEQPNPRKRCWSIHTSFRLMASFVAAPIAVRTPGPVDVTGRNVLVRRNGSFWQRRTG
jgi:hypothetical protein